MNLIVSLDAVSLEQLQVASEVVEVVLSSVFMFGSLPPKTAFSRFPSVHKTDHEGLFRVESGLLPRCLRMAAICALQPSDAGAGWVQIPTRSKRKHLFLILARRAGLGRAILLFTARDDSQRIVGQWSL